MAAEMRWSRQAYEAGMVLKLAFDEAQSLRMARTRSAGRFGMASRTVEMRNRLISLGRSTTAPSIGFPLTRTPISPSVS